MASTDGRIGVSLVSEAGYAGKDKPVAAMLVTPAGPKTRVVIPNIAAGRYAIQVMHDRTANGKLDTNTYQIDTRSGRVRETPVIDGLSSEFPSIDPRSTGRRHKQNFMLAAAEGCLAPRSTTARCDRAEQIQKQSRRLLR